MLPAQYYAESSRGFPDEFRDQGYTVTIASDVPEVVEVCANTVGFDQPSKNIPVDLSRKCRLKSMMPSYSLAAWAVKINGRIKTRIVSPGMPSNSKKFWGLPGAHPPFWHTQAFSEGKTAAVCSATPPVKHDLDYCEVLQSQGAICSQELIARDGLIVTAPQKSPYFVAGVIQVILETSPSAPSLLFPEKPSGISYRRDFPSRTRRLGWRR